MTDLHDRAAAPAPADPARLVPLAGTYNFRSADGYPTADGARIRAGRLFRSDALRDLTDADRAVLAALGLRTVVDLRETHELAASPDAVDGVGVDLVHVPVFEDSLFSPDATPLTEPMTMERLYDDMLGGHATQIATAVGVVVDAAADAPVVVHCTAGKDRTGVVFALALSVLGVPDAWVVDDYAATETFLGEEFVRRVEEHYARNGFPASMASHPTAAPPSVIRGVLERVRASHGSVEGFLVANGVSAARLARFREALRVG